MEAGSGIKDTIITILVISITMIAMIWGRTYYLQSEQFNIAQETFNKKNFKDALTGYESAIHMYTPWSSKIRISIEKIWLIGGLYEQQDKPDHALLAYRSLRSSLYAVRSFYTPYPEWIKKCDDKIASLVLITEGSSSKSPANPTRE